MRSQSLLAIALLSAACGGGGSVGSAIDAALVDAPPGSQPDAPPASVPDAAPPRCAPVKGTTIGVEEVVSVNEGLEFPVLVTAPAGDSRLFILERRGRIRIAKDGEVLSTAFLNIDEPLVVGGTGGNSEQGLLGLAFHPSYAQNGRFFVYYTGAGADGERFSNVVAEYVVDASNPDIADPTSRKTLLTIGDAEDNHNGGMIEFGPDGQLWIGTGDGGGQNDEHGPTGNAQNNDSLHGKILRLDVDAEAPQPTIWAKGLRNPWRWSFDVPTGNMYIGDVGQGTTEEIDVVSTSATNVNFGWNLFEGDNTFPGQDDDGGNRAGMTFPAVTQNNNPTGGWKAIVGGQVYRGACFPDIVGWYFYTDYVKGELWTFRWVGGEAVDHRRLLAADDFMDGPASIHADGFGELHVTDGNGQVKRIVARP